MNQRWNPSKDFVTQNHYVNSIFNWTLDHTRPWFLVLLLFIYNGLRGFLTWWIGPLRDEEERSGYSPSWQSYGYLRFFNMAVKGLLTVALITFAFHAYDWGTEVVWLAKLANP